jgi:hypothetical protein
MSTLSDAIDQLASLYSEDIEHETPLRELADILSVLDDASPDELARVPASTLARALLTLVYAVARDTPVPETDLR